MLVTPKIKLDDAAATPINAVAWSPDGSLIALAGYAQVRLVSPPDAEGGAGAEGPSRQRERRGLLRRWHGCWRRPRASRACSAKCGSGTWPTARWSKTLTGHRDSLYAVAVSPGRQDAGHRQLRRADQACGTSPADRSCVTLAGHNGAIFDLAFARNGKLLASASGDRTVKLWDVATGERLDTRGESLKEIYAVAFSPDGRRVAAGGVDNRIRVWQIGPAAKEGDNPLLYSRFAHEGAIVRLAWSPDGRWLASSAEDRTVKLWDAGRMVERHVLERQSDTPAALAFSPDNESLLVGRLDGTFAIYSVQTGKPIETTLALADDAKKPEEPKKAPPKPELSSLAPRGVQRGMATRVKLAGKDLAEISEIAFNNAKVTGKLRRGRQELGHGGLDRSHGGRRSAARRLRADREDARRRERPAEAARRRSAASGGARAERTRCKRRPRYRLPASVWGALGEKGDVDHFAFEARRGETIVLDLAASRWARSSTPC